MLGSEICEMLEIEYPIIQGGMAWVSLPELVAAVSNAGGLGVLAAGGLKPEELRAAIRRTRELTNRPFGVNLILWQVLMQGQMTVLVEEDVRVLMTGVGDPAPILEQAKENGMVLISAVGAVRHALRAQESGVDAIVAEGTEGGGHVGQVSTLCLVPQVVASVDLPVIAAGGIGDGKGMAASFALGARAVMMGTRFLASVESPVSAAYKARVLEANSEDAVIIGNVTGTPARSLRNSYTEERLARERDGLSADQLRVMGVGRLRRAAVEGDVDLGWLPAGQVCGLIDRLQSCSDIIRGTVSEAERILLRLGAEAATLELAGARDV